MKKTAMYLRPGHFFDKQLLQVLHGQPLALLTDSSDLWASLVAQMVKNLPAMWETWVRSLFGEDPLEEGMATHFSFLAWRIPWTAEAGGLQSMGLQRVGHD